MARIPDEVRVGTRIVLIDGEVFTDDFASMEREARLIASWGPNVYVKIPVTDIEGRTKLAQ